jgi:hypothetical protein
MILTKLHATAVAGLAVMSLGIPATAFAYDENDAIRDCNSRMRSEYKLNDFRDESAEQIKDTEKHFIVTGKTKVDDRKYGYKCEIKDRHVTSVSYDGPEPEGMSTAEKIAIGAAAAAAVGAAASALSKESEPAREPVETVAPRQVRTNADGSMQVTLAGGCTVRYNDIGLKESNAPSCTAEDLKSAEKAMTAYLNQ